MGLTSTGTNVASLQMKKEARDSEQWLSSSILEGGLIGTEFNLNQSDSLLDLTSELTGQRKGQSNKDLIFTWLEHNANIHMLVRHWYKKFPKCIKKLLATIIYFSGNSKLTLQLSNELHRSFDKYNVSLDSDKNVLMKIIPPENLMTILSTLVLA